jgi:hypothetical protein
MTSRSRPETKKAKNSTRVAEIIAGTRLKRAHEYNETVQEAVHQFTLF